jgi:hypothetical protein
MVSRIAVVVAEVYRGRDETRMTRRPAALMMAVLTRVPTSVQRHRPVAV